MNTNELADCIEAWGDNLGDDIADGNDDPNVPALVAEAARVAAVLRAGGIPQGPPVAEVLEAGEVYAWMGGDDAEDDGREADDCLPTCAARKAPHHECVCGKTGADAPRRRGVEPPAGTTAAPEQRRKGTPCNTKLLIGAGIALAALAGGHAADAGKCPRPPVVRVAYDDHRRIDVSPPQRLDVFFTRGHVPARYRAHWGSDSSLAWAQGECDDMGGHAVWHNGQSMVCQGVDY